MNESTAKARYKHGACLLDSWTVTDAKVHENIIAMKRTLLGALLAVTCSLRNSR